MRRRIKIFAALLAVILTPHMAFAQVPGETKDQGTNTREFTSNAVNATIISTIRQGYFRGIRKAFGIDFLQIVSLPPSQGGGMSGMAAGDEDSALTGWVNAAYQNYHSDTAGVSSKSNIYTGFVGADFVIAERFVAGLSTGYTTSQVRTSFVFAAGPTAFESKSTLDNWTIAPYGAALLTDNVYVDILGGITLADSRVNTLSDTNIVTESGDQDTQTIFFSASLNYAKVFDKINVAGALAYNYSINQAKAFVSDQGTDLPGSTRAASLLSVGGEVGYQFKRVAPYALAAAEYDLFRNPRGGGDLLVDTPSAETDRLGARVGLGVDFEYGDRIVGSFELSKVFFKEGVVDTSGFLNVRIAF